MKTKTKLEHLLELYANTFLITLSKQMAHEHFNDLNINLSWEPVEFTDQTSLKADEAFATSAAKRDAEDIARKMYAIR